MASSTIRDERSTRTRSLLFLAFGLAIVSMEALPLWIPENGFADAAVTRRACRRLPGRGSSINPVMLIFLRHTTGQSWLARA